MQSSESLEHADRIQEIAGQEAGASETREFRIFGPPGTGKTTNVSRQIGRAVERFGPGSILVTSFSRAAAAELAGRDLPIAGDRVGTLHSHCWHALGGPEIAESQVDEWNRDNPNLTITPLKKASRQAKLDGEESQDTEDGSTGGSGDDLLEMLNRFRGMEMNRHFWSAALVDFEKRWKEYKSENGLLDFTDLIDVCLRDVYVAPKSPSVIFCDEAQDLNRMQLKLVRSWGRHTEHFILAGDDDQTIYTFTGATPEAFLDPDIPAAHKIILKQSYRVPRAVHTLADRLIRRVGRRQEKEYLPRDADGRLARLASGTWEVPEYAVLETAMKHLDRGQSVMFLVACSYMLAPLIAVLRKNGVPFHNPYRKSNGAWNPMRQDQGSASNRLRSLLVAHSDYGGGARPWVEGDLALWAEWLKSKGILKHGAKAALGKANVDVQVDYDRLREVFEPAALDSLLAASNGNAAGLIEWWRSRVTAAVEDRVRFPAKVAATRGPHALYETPRAVVGTIHSVKGGEADVVVLFPDLSNSGYNAYRRTGLPHDSVIRQFYVGATRARETLYICRQLCDMAVTI